MSDPTKSPQLPPPSPPPRPQGLSHWVRVGPGKLRQQVRNFRVPPFSKILMKGGMEIIAAGTSPDGHGYFVPRWSLLDHLNVGWVAEKRSASSKAAIVKNFALHKDRIKRGVAEFFGAFPGSTWFIVGSGPSLIKNVSLLERHPQAKILAVNATLKAMRPGLADFYFTLDWLGGRKWLDGVDTKGVKLVCSVTCPPETLDRFSEQYHFVGMTQSESSETGINQEYAWLGQLDSGLTGTYSAMHFAWRCGAKRIVLVGQDFACRWGQYHWNEPMTHALAVDRKFRIVPDLDEGVTLTDDHFQRNCDLVKGACMWLEEDGVEVVNATEGGILDWNKKTLAWVYDALAREDAPAVKNEERVHAH